MTRLKDKVANALNETRTLILGAQILLGFQLHAVFQPGFAPFAPWLRLLDLAGLGLMCVAVALLIAPAAYHRLAEAARDTPRLHRFTTLMAEGALAPFGLSIGIDVFIVAQTLLGRAASLVAGLVFGLVAAFFWYGIAMMRRAAAGGSPMATPSQDEDDEGKTGLGEKIKTLMTELRVILPGVQALLGFQFIAFFSSDFASLPEDAKLTHFASLCCVAIAVILLMAPAAYHRVLTHGEDHPAVERFGSRALVAALLPLAAGLSSELYVVATKLGYGAAPSVAAAAVALMLFLGLWFAYPLAMRGRRGAALGAVSPRTE